MSKYTNMWTPISSVIEVSDGDVTSFATKIKCTVATLPTGIAGFQVGCIAQTTDTGTLYTNTGTVTSAIWTSTLGAGSSANTSPVYSLGSADNFATLAGTALTFTNAGTTVSAGNVGATTPTGTATTYSSGSYIGTGAPYAQAVTDVAALQVTLVGLTGTAIATPATFNTRTYTPGVYTTAASIVSPASSIITLSGAGDYVFVSTAGDITFGANTTIVLVNGATAARVFWVTATTKDLTTTGANSVLVGNFLVRDATVGSTVSLTGRILASRAVIVDGTATTMTIPGGAVSKISISELETGIAPSHVVKFAGKITWSGSGAALATTVPGVAATDIVIATVQKVATETGYIASVLPDTNTITITLSTANTTNDAIIAYTVFRAVA